MEPQSPHPPERRWTVTFDGLGTAVIVREGDGFYFADGGDPDDPGTVAGAVMRQARFGWPWVPGFSLPRTGFHEAMHHQLSAMGAEVAVDPPIIEGSDTAPTDGTIVG